MGRVTAQKEGLPAREQAVQFRTETVNARWCQDHGRAGAGVNTTISRGEPQRRAKEKEKEKAEKAEKALKLYFQ